MSEQPSFLIPETAQAEETTGRYIITFLDDSVFLRVARLSACS